VAEPRRRAFRRRLLGGVLRPLGAIGRRIPLPLGRVLGRALGWLAWHVARRERRRALANIAIAFPEWPEPERRRTIRAMFRHLGMSLFETLWLPNLDDAGRAERTTMENVDALLDHLRAGRGVIAITGHCGNWEWVANVVANLGYPLTVLQRERTEEGVNDIVAAVRAAGNVRTIDRGSTSAAREMIQALRSGGMLAFLIDQNIRAESVKVPFFGRPALTPIGPAKLAIRTGAVVAPIFIERRGATHHVRFIDPIATSRSDDPVALTARMTAEIEAQIRRAPEQWVWMHDRWRERPKWEVTATR
jgi:Kdo2-lipid IVA lauroyltransferase/acyltransferase